MARPTFTPELARKAAKLSAEKRRENAKLRRPLVLPSFATVEQVQAALELVARAVALGSLPGPQANAATKAAECWLRCEDHRLDLQRVKQMEARIIELERELAAAHRRERQREPWQDGTA
jgi:hypothetical protein